jgi:hypothetical protein
MDRLIGIWHRSMWEGLYDTERGFRLLLGMTHSKIINIKRIYGFIDIW